jgi:hypothetical protein
MTTPLFWQRWKTSASFSAGINLPDSATRYHFVRGDAMTSSAISSGLSGLQRATQRFESSAARIANPNSGGDLATEIVNVMMAKLDFEASTKVVKIAGNMQKSAIDILA